MFMQVNLDTGDNGLEEVTVAAGESAIEPFEAFYAAHVRGVLALAFAVTGNPQLAEDLTQDAFAVAFRKWETVGGYEDPIGFVRRVVTNRRVSVFRRSRYERLNVARLGSLLAEPYDEPEPSMADDIWSAVRQLPTRQVQVVALHYVSDLTLSQVAAVLGISKESVNTHLRRARRALAAALTHLEDR